MKLNYFIFLLWCPIAMLAQNNKPQFRLEADYYYGSILPHRNNIKHLIRKHPEGVLLSFNKKTFGDKDWQARFNYPDYGFTFHFQNNKNSELGNLYGLFAHYSFYFLHRHLQLRVAEGVAFATHPYDKIYNYRNTAYGTHFMPSTFFMLNYQEENIWKGFGIQAGVFLIHHSNAKLKAPNTSTNTVAVKLGINYLINHEQQKSYLPVRHKDSSFAEPLKLNAAFRWGIHESHIIGSGQYPFYHFSVYLDKRISCKSAFQAGSDLFVSMMRKREVKFMGKAFPETNIDPDADYKRIGAFLGYELFINKLSIEGQIGAYVYNKEADDSDLYQRLGLKYYVYNNLFVGTELLTHFSKAQAMEFSIGVRI